MPRKAKPPRLFLRKRGGREPVYVILDTGKEFSTGYGEHHRREAERRLGEYIAYKWEPRKGDLLTAEVLSIYGREHAPTVADPARIGYAMEALLPFWANYKVSDIGARLCREYSKGKSSGTARRDLGVLRAALNYCAREGYIKHAPSITLPERPPSRDRWLTRPEVARLLNAARKQGNRHLCRFILIAVYTGTRHAAILNLEWSPNDYCGHIDVENGLLYRSGNKERQTKKKRTPARLPRQLRLHARLWQKNSARYVIEYQGRKITHLKRSWDAACKEAKIEGANRHTLKHTAITWAMQNGAEPTQAAGYFATSLETITSVYLHHHPDFQASAVEAIERRPRNAQGINQK